MYVSVWLVTITMKSYKDVQSVMRHAVLEITVPVNVQNDGNMLNYFQMNANVYLGFSHLQMHPNVSVLPSETRRC